jgi:hypothetical protein
VRSRSRNLIRSNDHGLALENADINAGLVGAMRENIGSVGAMREREYFEGPQLPFNASDFPCRLGPALCMGAASKQRS